MTAETALVAVTEVLDSYESPAWATAKPKATVVVSSHNRARFLDDLIDKLTDQRGIAFEVIIVDNASADETWQTLTNLCATTPLPMTVLRVAFQPGPGIPRNTAITMARAELIAITDDDCLPTSDWLATLVAGLEAGNVIVQGKTLPEPGGWGGPWGRTILIDGPTLLYETANLGVRRDAFLAAGGFPRELILTGRPFGEDVVLGAAVARSGGFEFLPDALMHHRVLPGRYRDFFWERRRLVGFPELLKRAPELQRYRYRRVFFGRRRAITDVGLAGVVGAVVFSLVFNSPIPAVLLLAALPWVRVTWREALAHPGHRPLRVVQLMLADVLGAAALIVGSARSRRWWL